MTKHIADLPRLGATAKTSRMRGRAMPLMCLAGRMRCRA